MKFLLFFPTQFSQKTPAASGVSRAQSTFFQLWGEISLKSRCLYSLRRFNLHWRRCHKILFAVVFPKLSFWFASCAVIFIGRRYRREQLELLLLQYSYWSIRTSRSDTSMDRLVFQILVRVCHSFCCCLPVIRDEMNLMPETPVLLLHSYFENHFLEVSCNSVDWFSCSKISIDTFSLVKEFCSISFLCCYSLQDYFRQKKSKM